MRSRFTAYVLKDAFYVRQTMTGEALMNYNQESIINSHIKWIGLKIISYEKGSVNNDDGIVTFKAFYTSLVSEKSINVMQEKSFFKKEANKWYYIKGILEE